LIESTLLLGVSLVLGSLMFVATGEGKFTEPTLLLGFREASLATVVESESLLVTATSKQGEKTLSGLTVFSSAVPSPYEQKDQGQYHCKEHDKLWSSFAPATENTYIALALAELAHSQPHMAHNLSSIHPLLAFHLPRHHIHILVKVESVVLAVVLEE
jgi:hypothetical protein